MSDGPNDAPVVLYDTFAAEKRPLELLEPGKVGLYCCGPTVYDMGHIGHARAALLPDLLVRYLRHRGLEVTYVRNITDIDDKIIKRANERGVTSIEISERYTEEYQRDMRALGMLEPTVEPKVTEHVAEVIALVERLIARGLAYAVEGDVYYRVEGFEDYGRLSKRRLEDMEAGARVDVDARKHNPMDFVLWKAAKPDEPAWDSPWGKGRPGWHIECSAMSEKQLGPSFDIHCGGRDLIFPHHENEIAQSCGANPEETYARYWVHNGFVNFAGEKMSKSLGNFFTVREVMALYHPEVIRAFLMGVHYRSPVNFDVEVHCPNCGASMSQTEQQAGRCDTCGHEASAETLKRQVRFPGLEEADERMAYIYETLQGARAFLAAAKAQPEAGEYAPSIAGLAEAVDAAMHDDLNTAAALSVLSEPLAEANRLIQTGKGTPKDQRWRGLHHFVAQMERVAAMLGLFERDPDEWLTERRDLKARRVGLDTERVDRLVAERLEARAQKDWARADALRDELAELGVSLRDGAGATSWTL